ncbi:MAG: hypothetical protein AAF649_00450 [Verrucomicrobiota bacterium]
MSGIQDFVYALEVGSFRQWLLRLAILALLGGLGIFYFIKQFNGFKHRESMDMAQLSRQIALGEGYTTKFLRPIQLAKMRPTEADLARFPDVVNPPVFPYVSALLFKTTGASFFVDIERLRDFSVFSPERIIVLFNLTAIVAAVVLLYLWMLRSFDSRVATTACILFAVTDLVWANAIWGLNNSFITFEICLLGFLLNEALISEENDSSGLALFWFILASIVVGVLILTSYSMTVIYLPLIGLGVLAFHYRIRMAAVAVVLPLIIISPWLYRNFELTGHPFGYSWIEIFTDNGRFAGDSLWRIYDLGNTSPGGLKPLLRALSLGAAHVMENLATLMGGLIPVGLTVVGCFHMFRRHRSQASRWFWLAIFVALIVFNGALLKEREIADVTGMNLLITLLPVCCGFGAAFAFILFDRMNLPSSILVYPLVGLLCLLQATPIVLKIIQKPAPAFAYPPYFPPILFLTKSWIEPDEVMSSDIPWAVAWYSQRLCVWLPTEKDEFFALSDFEIKIVSILLTPESQKGSLFTDIESGQFADWSGIITRRDFNNLPLPSVTVLPPNKDDYLMLADRPRWKE